MEEYKKSVSGPHSPCFSGFTHDQVMNPDS
jgi:hypothetical protein